MKEPHLLALARKISYVIDPDNEYPVNYSGHIKVTLKNGEVIELRQPHMRGGKREPLSREELVRKFHGNAVYGAWRESDAAGLLDFCLGIEKHEDLSGLGKYRV